MVQSIAGSLNNSSIHRPGVLQCFPPAAIQNILKYLQVRNSLWTGVRHACNTHFSLKTQRSWNTWHFQTGCTRVNTMRTGNTEEGKSLTSGLRE